MARRSIIPLLLLSAATSAPLSARVQPAPRARRTGLYPGHAAALEGLCRRRDGMVRPRRRRAPPGPGPFRRDARPRESRDRRCRHRRGGVRRVPGHPGPGRRRTRRVQHSSFPIGHRRGLELPRRGRIGDHPDCNLPPAAAASSAGVRCSASSGSPVTRTPSAPASRCRCGAGHIGRTRPRRAAVPVEGTDIERVELNDSDAGLDSALAALRDEAVWIARLTMPLLDHGGAEASKAYAAELDAVGQQLDRGSRPNASGPSTTDWTARSARPVPMMAPASATRHGGYCLEQVLAPLATASWGSGRIPTASESSSPAPTRRSRAGSCARAGSPRRRSLGSRTYSRASWTSPRRCARISGSGGRTRASSGCRSSSPSARSSTTPSRR